MMAAAGYLLVLLSLSDLVESSRNKMSALILGGFLSMSLLTVVFDLSNESMVLVLAVTLLFPVVVKRSVPATQSAPYRGMNDHLLFAAALIAWLALRTFVAGVPLRGIFPTLAALLAVYLAYRYRNEDFDLRIFAPAALACYVGIGAIVAEFSANGSSVECRVDKCGIFGSLYRSIYPHENTLAIYAAMAIAFAVAYGVGSKRYFARVALLIMFLLASGGRSPLYALLAAAAVSVFFALSARRRANTVVVGPLTSIGGVSLVTLVAFWLMITSSPETFSGRGRVWIAGLEAAGYDDLAGAGIAAWSSVQLSAGLGTLSPHSIYLYLLVSGGLVALVLFGLLIANCISAVAAVSRLKLATALLPVLTFSILGFLETVSFVGSVDMLTPIFLLIVWKSSSEYSAAPSRVELVAA